MHRNILFYSMIIILIVISVELFYIIKPPVYSVEIKNPTINIELISKIESSDNPKAVSKDGKHFGLCQISEAVWNEETKKMYGYALPFWHVYDGDINKNVASYYYNVTIPKYLTHYNIPVNKDTIIAAYNYGIGNLVKVYNPAKSNWIDDLPLETVNYIYKYRIYSLEYAEKSLH